MLTAIMTHLFELFLVLIAGVTRVLSVEDADEPSKRLHLFRWDQQGNSADPLQTDDQMPEPNKRYYRNQFFDQEKILRNDANFNILFKAAFLVGRTPPGRFDAITAEEALATEMALAYPDLKSPDPAMTEREKFDLIYQEHVVRSCTIVTWTYQRYLLTFKDGHENPDVDSRARDMKKASQFCDRVEDPQFKKAVYVGFFSLRS